MHVNHRKPTVARSSPGAILSAFVLIWVIGPTGHAEQQSSLTDGIYSTIQATRGQELYQAECLTCHGDELQGRVGPPLAGDSFLAAWSDRLLRDLVDKIHNTMPPEVTQTPPRQRSLDLSAYVLQSSNFPAGETDLEETILPLISFPVAPASSDTASASSRFPRPAANLAQLMRSITFPNSNTIFNVQLKDPSTAAPPQPGSRPFDYVEWGSTVYPGWQTIDLAALALIESTPLFLLPGRRCENGRPVPVNQRAWQEYTNALTEAGRAAYRASQSRNADAVIEVTETLDAACANCHAVYRDFGSEGSSAGVDRCREVP